MFNQIFNAMFFIVMFFIVMSALSVLFIDLLVAKQYEDIDHDVTSQTMLFAFPIVVVVMTIIATIVTQDLSTIVSASISMSVVYFFIAEIMAIVLD